MLEQLLVYQCCSRCVLTFGSNKPGNIIWARFIPIIFSLHHILSCSGYSLGLSKIMLDIYDYGKAEIKTLISQAPLLFRALFATCCLVQCRTWYGVLDYSGSVFSVSLFIYGMRLVDKDSGVIDAFKESARLSSGVRWRILGLFSVVMLLVFIPFLFIPAVLALTYAYRKQQEYTEQYRLFSNNNEIK